MKPTMMFAVIALIAIVLMVAFDVSLAPNSAIELSGNVAANALYVCPIKDNVWTSVANGVGQFKKPLMIGLVFALMIITAMWSWALYQNLLKDKFDRGAYKTPWAATKLLFWTFAIMLLLIKTPDFYRTVHLEGASGNWVLCENNSPGAQAVHADKVRP